jgi:hypothetical protein
MPIDYMGNRAPREEHITCPKCECTFFENVDVAQYKKFHSVVPGQKVPQLEVGIQWPLLRCASCLTLVGAKYEYGPQNEMQRRLNVVLEQVGLKDEEHATHRHE